MGNGHSPRGGLFATVCECLCGNRRFVSAPWVRVVLGPGGHGQSLNQSSLMFWFALVLFSLKVLPTVLVDAGKGSVAISSHLTNLNFALQQDEMIQSVLSRFIFLHLLVFHCTSVRVQEIKSGIRLSVSYSHFSSHYGSFWVSGYQISLLE